MTDDPKDINDVFDDIAFSEEHLKQEGYQEGVKQGLLEGNCDGYHLGYHRGAEIGAELGYYLGVAESYLQSEEAVSDKIRTNLEKLVKLINDFPQENNPSFEIFSETDKIRSLYKKVCAQLKINAFYPELDNLSF